MRTSIGLVCFDRLRNPEKVIHRIGDGRDMSCHHEKKRKSGADHQRKKQHPQAERWTRRGCFRKGTKFVGLLGHAW